MGLTPIAGMPNYSGAPTYLIPARFWPEFLHKYYLMTTFREIANTDFEETIKGFGDVLHVRKVPDINTFVFNPGMMLPTQTNMAASAVDLTIDHGRGWRFPMDPVLLKQTDLKNVFDKWAYDAARQVDIAVETEMYAALPSLADSTNAGNTAGAKTGDLVLGAAGSGITLQPDDIVPWLITMERCLFQNNIIAGKEDGKVTGQDSKMFAVVPDFVYAYLMQAKLMQAIYTGDPESPLRTNAVGTVGPVTIYRSNNLSYSATTKETAVIFGVKRALSFALQLDIVETKPNPTYYGDIMQGLVVYGYNVMIPTGFGVSYVKAGSVTAPVAEG